MLNISETVKDTAIVEIDVVLDKWT